MWDDVSRDGPRDGFGRRTVVHPVSFDNQPASSSCPRQPCPPPAYSPPAVQSSPTKMLPPSTIPPTQPGPLPQSPSAPTPQSPPPQSPPLPPLTSRTPLQSQSLRRLTRSVPYSSLPHPSLSHPTERQRHRQGDFRPDTRARREQRICF